MTKSHIFQSVFRAQQRAAKQRAAARKKERAKQKREFERAEKKRQKELQKFERQEKKRRAQTWRNVTPDTEPAEMRRELRKLAQTVNRQARKMADYTANAGDVESPALRDLVNSGGYINPNVPDDMLYQEYIRAVNFMNDPTHTIRGFNAFAKEIATDEDAWRIVDKVAETVPRVKYDTVVRYYLKKDVIQPMIDQKRYTFDEIYQEALRNVDAIIRRVDAMKKQFASGFKMG